MQANSVYSRKISAKEAQNGFVFILKNKLSLFPPLGDNFELMIENSGQKVKLESYPCTCRGPDLPHEHYFIRWKGLNAGDKVEIINESENKNKYRLQIKKINREEYHSKRS